MSAAGPQNDAAKYKDLAQTTRWYHKHTERLLSLVRTLTRSYNHAGSSFSLGGIYDLAWTTTQPHEHLDRTCNLARTAVRPALQFSNFSASHGRPCHRTAKCCSLARSVVTPYDLLLSTTDTQDNNVRCCCLEGE